jgi:hypothetical protein
MGFQVHKTKPTRFQRAKTWLITLGFLAVPAVIVAFFMDVAWVIDSLRARNALSLPAAYGLGYRGCPVAAREPLVETLADGDAAPRLRAVSAWALGRARSREVVDHLETAARNGPPVVRVAAVRALGTNGDALGVDIVERAFKDPEASVRLAACEAAGDLRNTQLVPPLLECLRDPLPDLRGAAARSLAAIAGEDFGEDERAWRAYFKR